MYPNLEAEIKRLNLSRQDIAKKMNWGIATTSNKLTGKTPIDFEEAVRFKKDVLMVEIPLEKLFEKRNS
ncbi:hypothetical protein [Anaerorhabdus sp.]|uniref:hypothetical protein n=1 Tax=Anaerorhabdus sp. TaxID=1872524 RepID=UPI002B21E78F|nr:hypothetical protein [Anaerorhabdus sp.]MEA4875297.1 hypothetical protein [Anaerorhabdus sp.]